MRMWRWTAVGLLTVTASLEARAQSAPTLEAVRLHRADALALAQKDLDDCAARRCAESGRLSLLAGTLALSEGDVPRARTLLTGASVEEPLRPYLAYYQGQAHFYAGDAAAAAAAFGRAMDAAPPPALLSRARARRGEALLAAGKAKEAASFLEAAATAEPSAELLFQRAQARAATGNVAGQRADLRAVALRFAAHPYADEALAALLVLKPAPRLTLPEFLQRTRGFLDAGAAARALEELARLDAAKLARGKPDLARVALVRAQALYAAGQKKEAQEALAVARQGPSAVAAEAAFVSARRALKEDNATARKLMLAVEKDFPQEAPADEAGFFVGWLDLQAGHFEDAVKSFTTFDQRHADSRRRDEALWYRALAHLRLEQYPQSREVLESLVNTFPKSGLVPQARYWSARGLALGGAGADVTGPAYTAVIAGAPNSYYALLAGERLRELGLTPPTAFPEPPRAPQGQGVPPELRRAVALTQAGLFRDAAEEVQASTARIHGADQALVFAGALLRLGEFGSAHTVAARYLWGRAFGARAPDALAAFYPRAFEGAVKSEASRYEVSPYLVWAIMRRESAFRPEVASAADARGLMQVIPPTARAIARKLAEPEPAPAELFSPSLSIRYGAWYLAQLMKRFAHPALAAAAYNAGPEPTLKWVKDKGGLPLDLFVEEIPFRETRGYVKQVLADLYLYQSFYGDKDSPPQRLSLTVPAPATEGVAF
jgi:soluble lytic murein transglycosylase